MTAYEETLHVNPEKNFEELNNEFAKVKLSEKLAYCVGDPSFIHWQIHCLYIFTQMSLDYLPGSLV